MTPAKFRFLTLGIILASLSALAQQDRPAPAQPGGSPQESQKPAAPATGAANANTAKKIDRAASYYHYGLAHYYEQMVLLYGRTEFAPKAIEEYRLAMENDPSSEYLASGLAELYARTGRIREAVIEAQDVVKRDPNNLEARKLLGRIYLRSMGDMQSGAQSQDMLKLATEQYQSIVKLEPGNAENHLLLGRLYILNKEMPKAEAEFQTAIKLEPNSEEAVTNLAFLYNEEGNNAKAVETLNSVPEAARSGKLYAALGYTYEQKKDYKNAIAAYKQAVALDHDNLDAVRGLAQNLASDNQMDAALAQYLALEQVDPQDWQAPLQAAKLYQHSGKFDEALEQIQKAAALAPDSLEVPYTQAIILDALGKYDDSADLLKKLITATTKPSGDYSSQERGNRALFIERLGNVYREENRPLLAVDTFRKMIDLGGEESARGYQEIIETYREQKQWPEATKAAQEAAQKLPQDKNLKLALATQLADEGKAEEGIQTAKSLLKGTPEDREILISLSNIYSRLKRWKDAEDTLAKADKLSTRPDEKEYIYFLQGAMYERQKKVDLAEQMFRQVLKQDPNNSMTLNYLGYMLADHNLRLEEALSLIKKAITLDPQNGAYLDSLGWAYFKMGNFDQAEENLRKAEEKTPNDATIQDHLGELYAKTGRLQLAATHWEHALTEWNKSVQADVDQQDVGRVQKKLESTKVRLAQQRQ
jgi:tetratricopeptide (TPR) repeat protein